MSSLRLVKCKNKYYNSDLNKRKNTGNSILYNNYSKSPLNNLTSNINSVFTKNISIKNFSQYNTDSLFPYKDFYNDNNLILKEDDLDNDSIKSNICITRKNNFVNRYYFLFKIIFGLCLFVCVYLLFINFSFVNEFNFNEFIIYGFIYLIQQILQVLLCLIYLRNQVKLKI